MQQYLKTYAIIAVGSIILISGIAFAFSRTDKPCSRFKEVSYQDIAPAEATSTAPIFYGIDIDGRFCVLLKDVWVDTSKQY